MGNLSYDDITGLRLRYNLQFFAKEGPGGEKTEQATPKKLEDARKEGQVAKSQELVTAAALLGLFATLQFFMEYIGRNFIYSFNENYITISTYAKELFNSNMGTAFLNRGIGTVIKICIPIYGVAFVVAFLVNVLQVKFKITGKPLQPKFEKFNPIKGFKKMFSADKLVELIKSVLKILIIGIIVYNTLEDETDTLSILYEISLNSAIMLIGDIVIGLGLKISMFFLIIGLADYLYQKFKFNKDMRMTKQEIKDEFKQTEGDPLVKGRIRQKMREASQRRMMQQLPEADVVITNPTHLACAIKYDKDVSDAPVLIAKGADFLAEKIKEKARENNIPIVENKPLARMLYANVEIDSEIPRELYQMTAEVLAYVYSLK